jgi:hypothetical protein
MSLIDWVETVPLISLVKPRLQPCRIRKVPRVTTKLGSPVRTSMMPLKKPMARVTSSDTPTPTQTFAVIWYENIDEISDEEVTITPADRSNSPPIISSATGTAMIPRVDEA